MSPNDPTNPPLLPDPPQPQLSPLRVLVALLVLVAVGAGGFFALRRFRPRVRMPPRGTPRGSRPTSTPR
jgi:hypothetical protein